MSYRSWEDLLDEEEGGEDLGADAVAQASEALDKPPLADSEPLAKVMEGLDKARLPTELEGLARKIPGMEDLLAERDALRSQLARLTGKEAPAPERSLFGGTPAAAPSGEGTPRWERVWGQPLDQPLDPAEPSADDQRDLRRDAARSGTVFERTRSAGSGDAAALLQRARARRQTGHVSSAELPDPARSAAAHTRRLEQRTRRLEKDAPGHPARERKVEALKKRTQDSRRTAERWESVRDAQREKQAAGRRAQQRMNERQQRQRHGSAWLPRPSVSEMGDAPLENVGRGVQKLLLKGLGSTWGNRDGRLDMDDLFHRDEAKAEARRKKALERQRQRREEERRQEEQKQSAKERRREERRRKRSRD